MNTLARYLLALLRAVFWDEQPDAARFGVLSAAEWKALFKLAARQGVLAVAYDGVQMLPEALRPPREVMLPWAFNTSKIEEVYKTQFEAASALLGVLAERGIEPILLKGIALSEYYPVPAHRPCGDIDIYLGEQYDRLNRLAREHGTAVETEENKKHSQFYYRGVPVENHRTFVDTTQYRIDRVLEAYLQDQVGSAVYRRLAGLEYRVLPATADALFLVRHTARHLEQGIGLRHVCDWVLFVRQRGGEVDWAEFDAMIRQLRLHTFVAVLNGIACDCLGLPAGSLPCSERSPLQGRVLDVILDYKSAPLQASGRLALLRQKYDRLMRRRWLLQDVLHERFAGHVWRSVQYHVRHPRSIFASEK